MAQGETAPGSGEPDDPSYSYKPSLMGAPWEFWLRPDALEWRVGRHQGRTPYGNITRVRLSYRPITMQTNRFLTELWSTDGPRLTIASSSWRSMVEQGSQIEAYGAFVRELHARMAAGHPDAFPGRHLRAFSTGRDLRPSPVWCWQPRFSWSARCCSENGRRSRSSPAFLALFAWYSGSFFLRNRPRPYRPDAVPLDLVPLR